MVGTAPAATLNKFEKFKAEKDGLAVKSQIEEFAQMGWEAMDEDDRNHRLKWLGVFFRPVTPGKFMMRLRLPSGVITSGQMRTLAEIVRRYGDEGSADITTRQNIQMRGIRIEDLPEIFRKFESAGLTSIQSGMDNVRNITGSPVSGIDADELIDTRGIVRKVQDMITNNGEGNPSFTNLPRKFNIAIAGCRDNSVHAEINDIAFIPAYKDGKLGFNVLVGGFFSAKRCEPAIPLNAWVDPRDVVTLCRAILIVFRDHGPRANRQKSRLMWLIDEWGLETFRSEVEKQLGCALQTAAPKDEILWDKRDHIGIHAQKQPGLNYIGLHVPVGRLYAESMFDLARIADVYGSGELRLTVEQNIIIPNVPDSRIAPLLKESLLGQFSVDPLPLTRAVVSCTGAQFCNFAIVETKNRASALARELDEKWEVSKAVRMHWTGCPNSCGQPQVADIGFMGTKARKDGKMVDGVDIYMGGTVGKHAHLGTCVMKAVPCEDLPEIVGNLLVENFGAKPRTSPIEHRRNSSRISSNSVVVQAPAFTPSVYTTPIPPITEPAIMAPPATVVFAKSGNEVTCTEADSILQIAEQVGVAIDSSCQSGSCGTCAQKLVAGNIRYEGDPDGLDTHAQEIGMILTCVAHPIGRVVIDS
jgi:ferredoxin-nitrite reductase